MPNPHAFGTFVMPPADTGSPPESGGNQSSLTFCQGMHLLGMLTMISGFLGIIALGVLGATRSMPATLITHGLLFLTFVAFSIQRSGGLSKWRSMKVNALNSVHFSIIILVGFVFVIGGACIATLVEPGSGPNSMTKLDQIYFGIVIASIGGGVIPIAIADWMSNSPIKRRPRRRS